MALQCNSWKQTKNDKKVEPSIDDTKNSTDDLNKAVLDKIKLDDNVKYQMLREEQDFDVFLEKMNEIRQTSLNNQNLTDDERRKNAENAILMFSKYLGLDEEDEDEDDEEEQNELEGEAK
jgi:hypothetical protein